MLTAVAIAVDGLGFAAWLFLSSVGLTLIYGVMRILNIAHGGFYALGAYSSAWAIGLYTQTGSTIALTYLIIPLTALAVGVIAGLLIERGILRFMYGDTSASSSARCFRGDLSSSILNSSSIFSISHSHAGMSLCAHRSRGGVLGFSTS